MTAEGALFIGSSAAVLALAGVMFGLLFARIAKLEARLGRGERYNRRMWEWARKHVDLYYTHRRPGSPDPEPIPSEDDEQDQ